MLATAPISQLRALQIQLDKFRKRIDTSFANDPHHNVFGSLPGAGRKTAARLPGEWGDDRR